VGQRGMGGGNGLLVSWRCRDAAGKSAAQRGQARPAKLVPPVSLMGGWQCDGISRQRKGWWPADIS